ncbi:Putative outer membrane protein, probably involved in nutrient binding protein [Lunatimonas lonarensis]|uniref:Putative outer membrane protein, probably involved in nutrient binding protein n=1 Tax=Lunatimonas lonarensis TaxID=1232681 RepID=R7ZYC2_9BACT|nr:RagB/SusD family nutrient uptake outer membrane protein [Lunatimonas lonarensis]EON79082.1 Putative outer membrane protein, probably involved in nutrient binding protein [Lunatimonas lonarensis]
MNRIYYVIAFLAGTMLYSCDDDFLNRVPLDQISDPEFWNSTGDMELFLNTFYDTFDGWPPSGGGSAPTKDRGTDIALPAINVFGASWTPRLDGAINVPASASNQYWSWVNIRNINYFLDNVDRVQTRTNMTDHYIGEGHFFRAWFYYEMMKSFGALPIINRAVNESDEDILYAPRNNRTEVFNFILSDLEIAISKMRHSHQLATPGTRLSKDIALMFKARACLYEGTWEKYHRGTPFEGQTDGRGFLQQAADAALQIIDGGNFSLVTGDTSRVYADLFNRTNYAGVREVIFYKHYDRETHGNTFGNQLWNWPNAYGYTYEATKFFLSKDGLPIAVSPHFVGDATLDLVQVNRDPRLAQTVMVPTDIRRIQGTDTTFFLRPDVLNSGTGIESRKFRHIVVDPAVGIQNHNVDYIFMRLPEAMLVYAEAKAELGTLTQGDVDKTINRIRDRVGMPHLMLNNITPDPNWPNYGYALPDYLHEIRRERTVELFAEGFRFDDLMRWRAHNYWVGTRFVGTFATPELIAMAPAVPRNQAGFFDPYQNALSGPGSTFGFNPNRDYLMPLPTNELTLNTNLGQNPGW